MKKCKHCGQQIYSNQTHHCDETGESYSSDILETIILTEIAEDIFDSSSNSSDYSSNDSSISSSDVDFGGGDGGGGGSSSDF